MDVTGGVFLFNPESDTVRALQSRGFRGIYGYNEPERPLQELIVHHPEVIPGDQIALAKEDSPRFVLLASEVGLEGFSVDVLLADQKGVVTFVETKMCENAESRRAVIGQVIEYASTANAIWDAASVRGTAVEYWRTKRDRDFRDVLLETFGEETDEEAFWGDIKGKLEKGNIRIIIAADRLRPEVRRSIEYLNTEMRNVEFLGLEVQCYDTKDEKEMVLVARIVGQTQDVAERKSSAGERRKEPWTREDFLAAVSQRDIGKHLKELVQRFVEMATRLEDERLVTLRWGRGATGSVSIACGSSSLVSINGDGYMGAQMGAWKVSEDGFVLLHGELSKVLQTELPSERNKYPGITRVVLDNDSELKGIENWIRLAAKTIGGNP